MGRSAQWVDNVTRFQPGHAPPGYYQIARYLLSDRNLSDDNILTLIALAVIDLLRS
jgi:hypothetical protein